MRHDAVEGLHARCVHKATREHDAQLESFRWSCSFPRRGYLATVIQLKDAEILSHWCPMAP